MKIFKRKKDRFTAGKLFTPSVIISLAVLILIVFGVLFAGVLAPYDPDEIDVTSILQNPSATHWFGTDKAGRDVFSRILYGGRTSLLGALGIVGVSILVGIPIGLYSGYHGGKIDTILMRICDVIISFPALLLAFVFVASFGRSMLNAVLALGIFYIPMLAKLTRSLVMVEKNKVYVEAAKSIGYSDFHILFVQILPNCISTLLVQLTLDVGAALLDLASMSFLGLGVQPPTSDWGVMLEESRSFITTKPFMALAPGIMIIVVVVAINIFSDGVQVYLDHTQRRLPSIRKFKKKWGISNE